MLQDKIRIRDALKMKHPDFTDFCVSLDKIYIAELTTSDFVAFRTQYNVTREYVAQIRKELDDYEPDAEIHQEDDQEEVLFKESADNEAINMDAIEAEEVDLSGELELTADKKETEDEGLISVDDEMVAGEPEREDTSPGKSWCMNLSEIRGINIYVPLYEAFGIPRRPEYSEFGIEELGGLSTRSYNCLIRNQCKTYHMLFSKSIIEISNFQNLGKKSLIEIIEICKDFSDVFDDLDDYQGPSRKLRKGASKELLSVAEKIALGQEYDTTILDDSEKWYVQLLEDARTLLDPELCLLALRETDKAREIQSLLTEYIMMTDLQSGCENCIYNWSSYFGVSPNLHVLPFIIAAGKAKDELSKMFSVRDRISDVLPIAHRCISNNIQAWQEFSKWLSDLGFDSCDSFDDPRHPSLIAIEDAYNSTLKHIKRASEVINYRQEGKTLAEISDNFGLTRERIRQIEKRAIASFVSFLEKRKIDVIAYIHALLDGDLMIHKEEMSTIVSNSDQLNLLWACIQDGAFDSDDHSYVKHYHAVVFHQGGTNSAEELVHSLPDQIFADELEIMIRHAVDEEGVWEERIRAAIEHRYKLFGTLYSERRPRVTFICDWVLKNRFVNGYKVNDETDSKRFLSYMREVFGEESSHMTPHALDVKVGEVGVLCDRGKYIHPSTVSIDPAILDEVDQYIAESPKNAISFIELFEAFKDRLAGTQISNHYFLQGVMKWFSDSEHRRCQYYAFRDYITKDPNVTTTDELDAFVREHGIVHKTEIFAAFPALNNVTVGQVVTRCPNVFNIDGGYYIHASQFHIQEADYAPLRTYLTEATNELPVNIRKVFDDCSVQFPEFIDRNELHNRDLLFAALNYMFREEFSFRKPFIAKSDDVKLTNSGVILSILEPYDEIEIDELMDLLDERRIRYISISNLMQLIAPDYIRIDENTFMKRELTGIDDDVVTEALKILKEAIEVNGYLPSCRVLDFIWYPSIDVAWNPYLLESIVMSSDEIDYIPYTFSRSNRSLVVYVNEKYAHCDFQMLLLRVINEEYERGTFTRKADMRDWLIDAGLMDAKLPNFLESTQYYYVNDDGRLIRREEAEQ